MNQYEKYLAYLNSESWNRLRQLKFSQVGRRCQNCHRTTGIIHCHHIRYRNLTDCSISDLVALCNQCHEDFHVACKNDGIDYKEKELHQIIDIISRFRTTQYCADRRIRINTKKAEKKKAKSLKSITDSLRYRLKREFSRYKKSEQTLADMKAYFVALDKLKAELYAFPVTPQIP